jgi:hypothetical protein
MQPSAIRVSSTAAFDAIGKIGKAMSPVAETLVPPVPVFCQIRLR